LQTSQPGELLEKTITDETYYFIFGDPYGIYQTIIINRYNGQLVHSIKNKNDNGYEMSDYFNCRKTEKKF